MANNTNIPQVLLFRVEPVKAAQIESLCRDQGIRVSKVKLSDYSQKLGYLAGMPGFAREGTDYAGPELSAEMMVFSGMGDMLNGFLGAYKKAGIPAIGLKAVVTPHNIFWSAEELYRELFQEHQFFQNR